MGLLSYIAPAKGEKKGKKDGEKNATEMVHSPQSSLGSVPQTPWEKSAAPSNMTSPYGSRPASIYPVGDFRNNAQAELTDIKCDVMVNWLYSQQEERLWTTGEMEEGVMLKKTRGQYACSPAELAEEPYGLYKAVEQLNVKVSTTRQVFPKTI